MGKRVYVSNNGTWVDVTSGDIGLWSSYTPTIGGSFSIGNGSLVSKYSQVGKIVYVKIDITAGSTTSIGNGLTFTLPSSPVESVAGTGFIRRYNKAYPISIVYYQYESPVKIGAAVDSSGYGYTYSDLSYDVPTYSDLENYKTYNFANEIPDVLLIRSGRPISTLSGDIIEISAWYEVA